MLGADHTSRQRCRGGPGYPANGPTPVLDPLSTSVTLSPRGQRLLLLVTVEKALRSTWAYLILYFRGSERPSQLT